MDDGDNGRLTYTIISEDDSSALISTQHLFILKQKTGQLLLNPNNPLLNQSLGVHRLIVQVCVVSKNVF